MGGTGEGLMPRGAPRPDHRSGLQRSSRRHRGPPGLPRRSCGRQGSRPCPRSRPLVGSGWGTWGGAQTPSPGSRRTETPPPITLPFHVARCPRSSAGSPPPSADQPHSGGTGSPVRGRYERLGAPRPPHGLVRQPARVALLVAPQVGRVELLRACDARADAGAGRLRAREGEGIAGRALSVEEDDP